MPFGVTTRVRSRSSVDGRSRVARPAARREPRRHRRQRLSGAKRLRTDEMKPEVEIAEHEPALASPRTNRIECLPCLTCAAPATLRVVEPSQAVEHGVEVGRDVQPEHLEIVADVADHGQLTGSEHVVETRRELGTADAAGEQNDPHTRNGASARVRGPPRPATRSRSSGVSTSSRRFGRSTS